MDVIKFGSVNDSFIDVAQIQQYVTAVMIKPWRNSQELKKGHMHDPSEVSLIALKMGVVIGGYGH